MAIIQHLQHLERELLGLLFLQLQLWHESKKNAAFYQTLVELKWREVNDQRNEKNQA